MKVKEPLIEYDVFPKILSLWKNQIIDYDIHVIDYFVHMHFKLFSHEVNRLLISLLLKQKVADRLW